MHRTSDPVSATPVAVLPVQSLTLPPAPDAILTRDEVAAWLKLRPRQVERLGVPCLDLGARPSGTWAATCWSDWRPTAGGAVVSRGSVLR